MSPRSPLARLAGRLAGATSGAGRSGRLAVLIYHRVLDRPDPMRPGEMDARTFRWQMQLLAESFTPLPLAEALARLDSGRLPRRAVCVTFDDGYADNEAVALPILKAAGVPATFFVATAYLNGGRMWNDTVIEALRAMPGEVLDLESAGLGRHPLGSDAERVAAARALIGRFKYLEPADRDARAGQLHVMAGEPQAAPMMTDAQVRRLAGAGMEVGGHTCTHPILSRIPEAEARREMLEGRERLAAITGERVRLFAYPNGKPGRDYLPRDVALARAAGFEAAVATHWGVADAGTDRFQLPRFTPWDATPARFALRLALHYRRLVRQPRETAPA